MLRYAGEHARSGLGRNALERIRRNGVVDRVDARTAGEQRQLARGLGALADLHEAALHAGGGRTFASEPGPLDGAPCRVVGGRLEMHGFTRRRVGLVRLNGEHPERAHVGARIEICAATSERDQCQRTAGEQLGFHSSPRRPRMGRMGKPGTVSRSEKS